MVESDMEIEPARRTAATTTTIATEDITTTAAAAAIEIVSKKQYEKILRKNKRLKQRSKDLENIIKGMRG